MGVVICVSSVSPEEWGAAGCFGSVFAKLVVKAAVVPQLRRCFLGFFSHSEFSVLYISKSSEGGSRFAMACCMGRALCMYVFGDRPATNVVVAGV